MVIVRRENCHKFRTAFYINRDIDKRGRVAYVLGMWFAIPYGERLMS